MYDDKKLKIVGLVGSLRENSFHKALMLEAIRSCPSTAEIEILDIVLPPFNQDLEGTLPEAVQKFKEKIKSADAILMVSPEFNYSLSGVLKNAIDWASRPYGDNSFEGKPVGIMSASVGMLGGSRAQYHLRQVFVYLNMFPLNRPEVMVPFAGEKIEAGEVRDEKTKEKISELVEALIVFTQKLKNIDL